ncbi:phosphate acetyltransferase [Mycoplasmopsis synoviae]|uniref:phosphate acetyltransferase n=1 Tax=Mycoplasmopsis synoviae TaxID=2109 RepID=UPI0034DAF4B7
MNYELNLKSQVDALKSVKKIVLIDGDDQRALDAVRELKAQKNIEVLLLTEKQENSSEFEFVNIFADEAKTKKYVEQYLELRKNKETLEQAEKAMASRPFHAMMMLHNNEVDGVVGGLKFTTADILRAAFKVIGPKPGIKTISSIMVMHKEEQQMVFSDISVNVSPNAQQLSEIATNAAEAAELLGFPDPKVAFLSFSTSGSAVTEESKLVKEATDLFNASYTKTKAIGEVQLDAAIDLSVRKSKYKQDSYDEKANLLVFPNLSAGNIGYKLVQRYGNFGAIGPIIVGTKKPVNDLSRGSSVNDVVNTVLITALQSEGSK